MEKYYSALRAGLAQWAELAEEHWHELASIFRMREVAAREHLLLPGDDEHELLFVCHGLLRFYYLAADGKETNKAFIAENEFAGPLASAMLGLPVYYGIQALEPTTMLAAPFTHFTDLYARDPVYERLGRRLAELLLVRKELRTRSMLENNASERYVEFVEQRPELLARVPQYHLASYLGITEVSLSRLKNARIKTAVSQNSG